MPLFDAKDLIARTVVGRGGKRRLCRHPEMERAVIDLVDEGCDRADWRGLLYVMAWGTKDRLRPIYIGKAGRYGKTPGQLSANLANLASDKGKFARWGDGNAYHIGDLSQALFKWEAYKPAGQKYERWAEVLFDDQSLPRLREPVSLLLVPWHQGQLGPGGAVRTLEEVESEAIDLAIEEFEDVVLNVQGETWWAPAAAPATRATAGSSPRRPFELLRTTDALARAVADLGNEALVGLDVETSLFTQELCLVQVSTRSKTLIVDPLAVSLEPLRCLLEIQGPTKVIHNAPFERRILRESGFEVAEVFDTLKASRLIGPRTESHRLSAVCERHLGRALDKSAQSSNWRARPLSPEQLTYAAVDAEVLLDLHEVLHRRLPQNTPLFTSEPSSTARGTSERGAP